MPLETKPLTFQFVGAEMAVERDEFIAAARVAFERHMSHPKEPEVIAIVAQKINGGLRIGFPSLPEGKCDIRIVTFVEKDDRRMLGFHLRLSQWLKTPPAPQAIGLSAKMS